MASKTPPDDAPIDPTGPDTPDSLFAAPEAPLDPDALADEVAAEADDAQDAQALAEQPEASGIPDPQPDPEPDPNAPPPPVNPLSSAEDAQRRVLYENVINEGAERFVQTAREAYIEAALEGKRVSIVVDDDDTSDSPDDE